MKKEKITLNEQEILEELEAEETQYEKTTYILVENQDDEKEKFKATVEANIKQKNLSIYDHLKQIL